MIGDSEDPGKTIQTEVRATLGEINEVERPNVYLIFVSMKDPAGK